VPEPTPPPLGAKGRELVETGKLRLENVFFESGSANLLPESEDELSQLGTALERFPEVKLEIQGHTDTRGAASGNMRLSQARRDAVRTWLLSHYHGIHDANLTAKGTARLNRRPRSATRKSCSGTGESSCACSTRGASQRVKVEH
jgi:outer membrane protein OmpA-like peptidoglycan-associated protein